MQPDPSEAFLRAIGACARELTLFRGFDRMLAQTQSHTNLIARSTWEQRWDRHYRDSAQLFPLIPARTRRLLDIGSGAGFPGIPLAILALQRAPQLHLHLAESVGKKARFLEEVATSLPLANVTVLNERIDARGGAHEFDLITARAVTALPDLLALAAPRLARGGCLLFPKGRRAQEELDAAAKQWSFSITATASETDPQARILAIRELKRRR